MGEDDMPYQLLQMTRGHWAMALCCVLYLVWWCVFFWPAGEEPAAAARVAGVACILGAVVCGGLAVWLVASAFSSLRGALPGPWINVGGVVAYFVLLAITAGPLHRQPTTELVLFVGWAVLELGAANALAGAGVTPAAAVVASVALVAVAFATSLVCYVLYYRLGPMPSFVDGCVPLATVGAAEVVMALLLTP